jgi:hypothetical protein
MASGKSQVGDNRHNVLNAELARRIKDMAADGTRRRDIASALNVPCSAVNGVIYGYTWKDV